MFCVHNYLVGGCQVAGPECPRATVEERRARIDALYAGASAA